jgi:hypothetical protein
MLLAPKDFQLVVIHPALELDCANTVKDPILTFRKHQIEFSRPKYGLVVRSVACAVNVAGHS